MRQTSDLLKMVSFNVQEERLCHRESRQTYCSLLALSLATEEEHIWLSSLCDSLFAWTPSDTIFSNSSLLSDVATQHAVLMHAVEIHNLYSLAEKIKVLEQG